eukprot:12426782-Karenia_brevis.AAC.1
MQCGAHREVGVRGPRHQAPGTYCVHAGVSIQLEFCSSVCPHLQQRPPACTQGWAHPLRRASCPRHF